jgi:single-strand DNA-binding protein
MATFNKIIIVGNLGRDPEMRYTPTGKAVTDFSVATTRVFTSQDGQKQEETDWFRVSVFGKQAEFCNQYLQKGKQVYVEGRLHARQYDKSDGTKGLSLDVRASDVQLIGRRSDNTAPLPPEGTPAATGEGDIIPDEIDFSAQ